MADIRGGHTRAPVVVPQPLPEEAMRKERAESEHGRARRPWSRVATALVVVLSMVMTGLAYEVPPAAAANGTGPADLINVISLYGANPLYTATSAQQASLEDLEQQAVANTLNDHGLPQSDAAAAQTWGRDVAEGELWALLVQAINTPAAEQTTDQANAVAWLSSVVQRQNVQAADDAGLEYTKWAGLGATSYENLLATNPSEDALQTFLSGTPLNYSGDSESTPESTSNEGYCDYEPPAPDSAQYPSNIYSSTPPQTCFTSCTSLLGCPPPTPSESDFVTWGAADADNEAFDNASFTAVANDVGEGLGFGAALVGAGVAGVVTALSLAYSGVLVGSSLAAALAPFGGVAAGAVGTLGSAAIAEASAGIVAADIGGVVAIVIAAIAIGVIATLNVVAAAELPGQLASLVYTAPTTPVDLASMLQNSDSTTELYSLFIGSTLPEPSLSTCDNSTLVAISGAGGTDNPVPCLNAPAIPLASASDPTFTITEKGATTSTTSSTLNWADAAEETTNSAYVSGDWFVNTETSGSTSLTLQSLDIHYTNWAGVEETAWLIGNSTTGYEFVIYQPDTTTPISSSTCVSDGTCAASRSIEYVGTDGHDYTATFPAGSGIPAVYTCPASEVCFSTSTSLTNAPQVPEVEEPVTLTAVATGNCVMIIGSTTTTSCTPVPGTVDFVDDVGGADTTLCAGVDVSSSTGTATCSWAPTTTGVHNIYATYNPQGGSENDGSQAELTLTVGTKASTVTTVTASSTTPPLSSSVVYTAAVADAYAGGASPSGTVTFSQGSTVLCPSVSLVEGSGRYTATCTTSYDMAGPETVTATYSGDAATTTSSGSVTVSVSPGPTVINVSVPPVIVAGVPFTVSVTISAAGVPPSSIGGTFFTAYDAGNPSDQYFCAGLVSSGTGSCPFTEATAGPLTLGVSFSEPYNDWDTAVVTLPVTVNPTTITVGASGSQVYGSTTPSFTYTSDAPNGVGVAGQLVCTTVDGGTPIGASLAAGPHTLDGSNCSGLSLTGPYASEFSLSYAGSTGGYVVNPAPLTITASSGAMTYGGAAPPVTASYSGFVNGDSSSSLTTPPTCSSAASSSSPVGTYPSSCAGAVGPNYDITYVPGSVEVAPAPLAITASSPAMTYGGAVPAITPVYSGFVNGDSATSVTTAPTCTTTATSSSSPGSYPSNCSGAVDANYAISYTAGSVSVGLATLTITATSATMTYGGAVPEILPLYGGFTNGDSPASLTTPPSCSTNATVSSAPGTYSSSCSGAADPNYAIGYTAGTVTVAPAPLVITATSATMTYGGTVPDVTPVYSGFVNGDSATSLTTPATCSTTATSSSPPGTYPATCSGATDANYDITYVAGSVKVGPAPLTITASSALVPYLGAVPAITASYSGFVNGEGASSLTTAPVCSTTAVSGSPVGTYPSSCSGATGSDYSISYVPGTVTVFPHQVGAPTGGGSASGSQTPATGGQAPTATNPPPKNSVNLPKIASLSPLAGPQAGGTTVAIKGNYFVNVEKVRFGSKNARFTVVSAQEIRVVSPPGTGTVAVSVTTAAGRSAGTKSDRFAYLAKSQVLQLSPAVGPRSGGTTVVITGTTFVDVKKVSFGARTAKFSVLSTHKIMARSPAGDGSVRVSVTTGAGTSASRGAARFTYSAQK